MVLSISVVSFSSAGVRVASSVLRVKGVTVDVLVPPVSVILVMATGSAYKEGRGN